MNNKIIIGIIFLVIVVGGVLFVMNSGKMQTQTQQPTQTGSSTVVSKNTVTIRNMAFSPASLTVKVGDTVTWTNEDSAGHSVTADDNSFDTGILETGQSGSNTFTKAGTYTYHCKVHPSMTATIVVE